MNDVRIRVHNLDDSDISNISTRGNYYSISSQEFEILWNCIELAEVMLYCEDLGTDSDAVFNYLHRKYHGI